MYIKNPQRIHRMGSKMKPRWIGPYTVIKSLNKGLVKLKNGNGKILKRLYHASNLKLYTPLESRDHQAQNVDDPHSQCANELVPQEANDHQSKDMTTLSPSQEMVIPSLENMSRSSSQNVKDYSPSQNLDSVDDLEDVSYIKTVGTNNSSKHFKPPLSQIRKSMAAKMGLK